MSSSVVPKAYSLAPALTHSIYTTSFSGPSVTDQWRGVYYASGTSKREQRRTLLQEKQMFVAEEKRFGGALTSLLSKDVSTAQPMQRLQHALALSRTGQFSAALPHFEALQDSGKLVPADYVHVIRSFSADALKEHIYRTTGAYDSLRTQKLLSDNHGHERVSEAQYYFDCFTSRFPNEQSVGAVNALMEVMLTGGYRHCKRVHGELYDTLGARGVSPTLPTYLNVMQALGMTNNTDEMKAVMSWIRSANPEKVDLRLFSVAMDGFRNDKNHEECDMLWTELATRRFPRPDVHLCESYLRSIIDLAYTPVAGDMSLLGPTTQRELKRLPLVVEQMQELGIPQTCLSPPLQRELLETKRKYEIYRSRFYNWGRAVKQFSFLDFRKKKSWVYDINELLPTTDLSVSQAALRKFDHSAAPFATAKVPSFFRQQTPWAVAPLDNVLNHTQVKEQMQDTKMKSKFVHEKESLHQRSPNWKNETPQTRYDQLYGQRDLDMAHVGIRRHLATEGGANEDVAEKDASLMRKAMSSAKRVRERVDHARTHISVGKKQ